VVVLTDVAPADGSVRTGVPPLMVAEVRADVKQILTIVVRKTTQSDSFGPMSTERDGP